jgi:hypothetical protein
MIQFIKHDNIDKTRWDACIGNSVNGNLNSCFWFLDIVSPGWCALIEDDYERVFPLPVLRRFGVNYIMQPYFTQQLGLFYQSTTSEKKLLEFLHSIPSDFRYIDINLNTSNRLIGNKYVSDQTNLELDLINDYSKIAIQYQNNLKRNLKKAAQSKLTKTKHVRPEELISLFRANKGKHLQHLQDDQYALIQRIAYESIHRGIGEIWGAYDEFNQLTAGILWITSNQKTIFLFSALSETGKQLNAMPWLIDAYIQHNSGRALTLDFEGSNDPGLARFYESFGAEKVIYQRYKYNSLPLFFQFVLKLWRKDWSVVKKINQLVKRSGKVLIFV